MLYYMKSMVPFLCTIFGTREIKLDKKKYIKTEIIHQKVQEISEKNTHIQSANLLSL